jgi:hypothetical protein
MVDNFPPPILITIEKPEWLATRACKASFRARYPWACDVPNPPP